MQTEPKPMPTLAELSDKIDRLEAITLIGARISELRSQGVQISKEMVASKSRITGKTVHFAKYRLTATPEAVRGQVNP